MDQHPADFDPFSPATIEDPYPFYRALRTHAPVYRPPGADWYYVSRHHDIQTVSRDTETYSSNIVTLLMARGTGELIEAPKLPFMPVDVLAIADPPNHGRHRKRATTGLGRAFPHELEPELQGLADELIAAMLERGGGDWMQDFAFRVPIHVALRLLALDPAAQGKIKAWSDDAIDLLSGMTTRWGMARDMVAAWRLWRWCVRRFRAARARPPAGLMGSLVEAVEAGSLSATEAASIVLQIVIAGSDSSASLMGSAVRLLAEAPDLQAQLRAEPSLIPAFIEETIRLEAPFQGHFRQTTRACELAGVPLEPGTRLFLSWASGNRDERQFEAAEQIDLARKQPRSHLSFGHGIHLCIGAALGRLEARVALTSLLAQTKSIVSLDPAPRHRPSIFVRTLERLPLRLEPRERG